MLLLMNHVMGIRNSMSSFMIGVLLSFGSFWWK